MDNNAVKKILTFKSGKFVFSQRYDTQKLLPSLVEAKILYETVKDLPILPALSTEIQEELIRRSIFGTAALEGNPLTEGEVAEIISEPERTGQIERAEKEIQNLKKVYDFVSSLKPSSSVFEMEEELIRKIHFLITRDIEYEHNLPGQYRNHPVKVGNTEHGGIYTPPKCLDDIKTLMKEFVTWINSEEVAKLDPTIRATLAHYYLGLIHPFGNGNGRTARIIEALLLRLAGIKYVPVMLSNYYYRNMDDYFWAFSNARKNKENDITPFIGFVLKGVIESLNIIKERIMFFIRKFALRDYYTYLSRKRQITERQYHLLNMLLDNSNPFTLRDLFEIPPFNILYQKVSERTARRDLKKLSNSKLLNIENGMYNLNFKTLD